MRVLVTGGAGYIGSHACAVLLNAGHEVVIVDNLSRGHKRAVDILAARAHGRVRLVQANLSDADAVRSAFEPGVDAVMHFAAFANVGEGSADPNLYYRNNVAAIMPLLDAIRAFRVPRVIYSSSCSVYGQPSESMIPVPETAPLGPISSYGRTKLIGEQMLGDLGAAMNAAGQPVALSFLRYFNVAGCEMPDATAAAHGRLGEDHDPELHLIPLVLRVALGRAKSIKVFGTDYPTPDGTCIRDYIHVSDIGAAHLAALERTKPGETLACNLGIGKGASVKEIIGAAERVTGVKIATELAPRRVGDPARLFAKPELAFSRLGWKPHFTEIEKIIESAYRWFRDHPNGMRS